MYLASTKWIQIGVLTMGFAALAILASCNSEDDNNSAANEKTVASLRLIGQQVLPRRSDYADTVVGGLSGVDYDESNGQFLFVSDDRTTSDSANAPRMYMARLTYDATAFSAIAFTSTFSMKQPDGNVYPKVPDSNVADPESVRIDFGTQQHTIPRT